MSERTPTADPPKTETSSSPEQKPTLPFALMALLTAWQKLRSWSGKVGSHKFQELRSDIAQEWGNIEKHEKKAVPRAKHDLLVNIKDIFDHSFPAINTCLEKELLPNPTIQKILKDKFGRDIAFPDLSDLDLTPPKPLQPEVEHKKGDSGRFAVLEVGFSEKDLLDLRERLTSAELAIQEINLALITETRKEQEVKEAEEKRNQAEALRKKEAEEARKQEVEKMLKELKEQGVSLTVSVPDAKNPFAAERKTMEWNLIDTLRQDQEYYRSMGLSAWADNIAEADFSRLTPEKLRTIDGEIKDGAIPVFMPDKNTQLNTSIEQFRNAFKPIWIKNNAVESVEDAYLEWDHFIKLITDKAPELVAGVPDRPYLSMMKPFQKPDDRTTNKTVANQLLEFAKINAERQAANQPKANVTNPHEYGALTTVSSRHAKILMPGLPTTLNPIDSATFTRFINLPFSPDRHVPNAYFNPAYSQAKFDRTDADYPYAKSGFRLSVRVEF